MAALYRGESGVYQSRVGTCTQVRTLVTMSEHAFNSVHYEDGWIEIREDGNAEGWIATDSPMWIEL